MKNLTMIAAIGKNNELGKNNDLIWRFHEDMKFFRSQTIDKPIVMGMNTFRSLPKLLPRRKHIVLTRKGRQDLPDEVIVIKSLEELLEYVDLLGEEVMVIGGASIYQELLEYSDRLVLTEIDAEADADVYFPKFDKEDYTQEFLGEHEEEGIKFKHLVYTRKDK